MKQMSLLLGSMLMISAGATAQLSVNDKDVKNHSQAQQLISAIMQKQAAATANKTTATVHERLVAQSAYSRYYDFVIQYGIVDSEYYTYNSGRSSAYDYNELSYHTAFESFWQQPGVFTIANNIGQSYYNVPFDKGYRWERNASSSSAIYGFKDSMDIDYGTGDRISSYVKYGLTSRNKIENTYSPTDKLQYRNISDSTASAGWQSREITNCAYNALDKLEADTTYVASSLVALYAYAYSYNSANNLSRFSQYNPSASWHEGVRYDIEYYSSAEIKKLTQYNYDIAGVMHIAYVDSFGWTPGVNGYTFRENRIMDNDTTSDISSEMRHISATTHLPDTISVHSVTSTGYESNARTILTYDAYSRPTSKQSFLYDSATSGYNTVYNTNRYYYDTYFPDAVENVSSIAANMIAYPNPATNVLNISFSGLSAVATMHLKLMNALGQVVIEKDVNSEDSTQLSLANIPAGVYWLVAEDAATHQTLRQSIMKQ